jgi:hypothetical protein
VQPVPINLAVEDVLSEQVLRALLQQCGRDYEVGAVYRKGGFGYLRTKLAGFNNAAKGMPYLILTDLDSRPCPTDLIETWFGCELKNYSRRRNHNLLFFIAVREVEAWLLADRESFASFLRIKVDQIPRQPDQIAHPKKELIDLVRKTKIRRLREDIVPRDGSIISIGPDYNGRLAEFVGNRWRVGAAENNSPSLRRAGDILRKFLPKF